MMNSGFPSPPGLEPLAVSIAAATRLASVGRTRLDEVIGTGDLASRKVGKRRPVLLEALRNWLNGQRQKGTAVSGSR